MLKVRSLRPSLWQIVLAGAAFAVAAAAIIFNLFWFSPSSTLIEAHQASSVAARLIAMIDFCTRQFSAAANECRSDVMARHLEHLKLELEISALSKGSRQNFLSNFILITSCFVSFLALLALAKSVILQAKLTKAQMLPYLSITKMTYDEQQVRFFVRNTGSTTARNVLIQTKVNEEDPSLHNLLIVDPGACIPAAHPAAHDLKAPIKPGREGDTFNLDLAYTDQLDGAHWRSVEYRFVASKKRDGMQSPGSGGLVLTGRKLEDIERLSLKDLCREKGFPSTMKAEFKKRTTSS